MKKLVLTFMALTVACGEKTAPPPVAPEVVVAAVSSRDVPVMAEFTGEIRGAEDIQVMARVAGFLQEQAYREGELVRKGDLLFVIDPKPFQAAESKARADVAQSLAMLNRATVQVNRLRPLAAQNAVSKQDLDNAEANAAIDRPSSSSLSSVSDDSSTLRPSERISLTSTLKLSGMPASKVSSPLTIAS